LKAKLTNDLLDDKQVDKAKEHIEQLSEKYPNSNAAEDAKKLLTS
jgi:TolA-binding protein